MLVAPAYAKVNLALEVTRRRPDGWHDIATVIATIDWHDLVSVETVAAPAGTPAALRVTGPFAEGVPTGQTNLAARAAALLLHLAGNPPIAFALRVRKDVPSAAGLGGGSADAAAVLRTGAALLAAAGIPLSPRAIAEAAADLGSDVPALLAGGTVLATGRGEQLTPLPTPRLHLAVALAGGSRTAAAYAALDDAECRGTGCAQRLATALDEGGPLDPTLLGSALEAPACRAAPQLREALDRLRALTPGDTWHLTGSGGAAFALAEDRREAEQLAACAVRAGFPARACRTVAHGLGPLPPARTAATTTTTR